MGARCPALLFSSCALAERDDPVGSKFVPRFFGTIRPLDLDRGNVRFLSQAEVHSHVVRAEVAAIRMHTPPERFLAVPYETHAGADSEAVAFDRL